MEEKKAQTPKSRAKTAIRLSVLTASDRFLRFENDDNGGDAVESVDG